MFTRWREYFRALGPGIVTGSSDNDPAGISTYSIAGAAAGYTFLWLIFITVPMMVAIQGMVARIGAVREEGLGHVITDTFGRRWFTAALAILIVCNVATIGANLAGMAAAAQLLTGIDLRWFVVPSALAILLTQVFWSYRTLASYLKYLSLVLFAYVISAFLARPDWHRIAYHTFVPDVIWSRESMAILVAVLGTTISPYMFFWHTSQVVEEIKERHEIQKSETWRTVDTAVGMMYSNFVSYFIILTSAATLHRAGIRIETAAQAAQALHPLAGDYAFLLFSIGIIGSGFLAIPVIAGATAYPMAEWIRCRTGLNHSITHAPCFYSVLGLSVIAGMVVALLPINPISAIFYSQVLAGFLTPVLLALIMLISCNKEIMGPSNVNNWAYNVLGWLTIAIMTVADLAVVWMMVR